MCYVLELDRTCVITCLYTYVWGGSFTFVGPHRLTLYFHHTYFKLSSIPHTFLLLAQLVPHVHDSYWRNASSWPSINFLIVASCSTMESSDFRELFSAYIIEAFLGILMWSSCHLCACVVGKGDRKGCEASGGHVSGRCPTHTHTQARTLPQARTYPYTSWHPHTFTLSHPRIPTSTRTSYIHAYLHTHPHS